MDARSLLKKLFGYSSFRPGQEEIISAMLSGRDVMAVLPTGGGKSLCYLLPAVMRPGITVVVSPLLSLIRDQLRECHSRGIPAISITSEMSREQVYAAYSLIAGEMASIVYIAPERVLSTRFRDIISKAPVSFWIFDEAHCIAEWGAEFRPAYLRAAEYVVRVSDAPVAAFTATATARTRAEIAGYLGMQSPYVRIEPFNRPNLKYYVYLKAAGDEYINQIRAFVRTHDGPGIIYAARRTETALLARHIDSRAGVPAACFHAGMPAAQRAVVQNRWMDDRCRVIVATIAFGMGVNKRDVRWIVHADIPKNIEGYAQETGRAGRDSRPAVCALYYRPADLVKQRCHINATMNPVRRQMADAQLSEMVNFVTARQCRHKVLSEYFGQRHPGACGACDNCMGAYLDIPSPPRKKIFA